MAITDVDVFAHLTDADIESLGVELDAIRQDIEDSRGARDARYIRRTIAAQRAIEVAGRVLLAASSRRSAWLSMPSGPQAQVWRSRQSGTSWLSRARSYRPSVRVSRTRNR